MVVVQALNIALMHVMPKLYAFIQTLKKPQEFMKLDDVL